MKESVMDIIAKISQNFSDGQVTVSGLSFENLNKIMNFVNSLTEDKNSDQKIMVEKVLANIADMGYANTRVNSVRVYRMITGCNLTESYDWVRKNMEFTE